MFKKILIVLVVIVAAVAVVGFFLPTEYDVGRSVVIDAPPAKVHDYVGNLKKWEEWGPWQAHDSSIKITYGEKTQGVGAHYSWTSQDGPGELTITKSDPQTGVEYDMLFDNQFKAKGAVTYAKEGDGTRVTWSMSGNQDVPVVGGYFAALMDTMVGSYFEEGLANLKKKVEG